MANRFTSPNMARLYGQQQRGLLSEMEGYPGGIPSQTAPYFVSVDRSKVAVPETIRNAPIEVEVLDDPTQRSFIQKLMGGRLGSSSVEGRSKGENVMQLGTGIGPEQRIGNEALRLAARQEAERLQAANKKPVFDPSTIPAIYGGQGRFTGSPDVPLPNQITMPNYPNYRDQSVVNEALRVGKRVADASNEEKRINANNIAANNRREGFIESLLGDIDFKSLAKSPLVMQALQGLSRMPTNQAQFGDSMVTGFTRGMQQFGAEEQAKAKEQAAIDLEQSRYDAQQAAAAASTAESLRRYEEGRTLDRATLEARRLQNYIKQNEIATKTDTDNYKKSIAQLIRKNPVIKDIIKSEKGGFFSKLSEEDIIEQTIGEAIIIYNSRLGTQDQVNKKDAFVLALGSVSGGSLTSSQENSAKDTVANAYRVDGKSLVKSK